VNNLRVAIVGSREWDDWNVLRQAILLLDKTKDVIISGGARGVDRMAVWLAKDYGFKIIEHLPDWDKFGRGAGYLRNEEIVADADIVLAFWDGESRGTLHTITIAEQASKPCMIYTPGMLPEMEQIESAQNKLQK